MLPGLRAMLAMAGIVAALAGLVLPVVVALPAAGAGGALSVMGARLGLHPNMTRFVLEIGGPVTYRTAVLSDPYRVVVDLPEVLWPGGETRKAGAGAIRGYHLERLRPGAARLVLETTGPVRIHGAVVIPPSEGHQTRFVLDVEPISAKDFRQVGDGPDTGPPPGEAVPQPTIPPHPRMPPPRPLPVASLTPAPPPPAPRIASDPPPAPSAPPVPPAKP